LLLKKEKNIYEFSKTKYNKNNKNKKQTKSKYIILSFNNQKIFII